MPIKPRLLKLHPKSKQKLICCKREAEQAGEYRVAKRIHAVLLNHQEKTTKQQSKLCKIIDHGPLAYGFTSGIWTSIMIGEILEEEYLIKYHPGHVRKLLRKMNYSMQKPKRVLARADNNEKMRWKRYVYPNIKKKPMNQAQQ